MSLNLVVPSIEDDTDGEQSPEEQGTISHPVDVTLSTKTDLFVSNVDVEYLLTIPAPYNPRNITDHDLHALRRSLRFFGPVEPVVVNTRTWRIVGGHQRVKAASLEQMRTFPTVFVDLDEPSEMTLNLALNRISGTFDVEALSVVLGNLDDFGADLSLTGFEEDEIKVALEGWDSDIEGLDDIEGHTDGITSRIVVECEKENAQAVRNLVTKAVEASGLDGVTVK